ncbi:MAG TPA: DUF4145 domain-containing protein [Bacteroidales bacterium]|nr:DUF4145 domain-containing protein [Bacteroidales bacterium]
MKQLNYLEVETSNGYKSISVYHGDILTLEKPADILFVSIFSGGLIPLPGTLLGSLKEAGIDPRELYENKLYDFTKGLNTWLSQPLEDKPFIRVMFFEMRHNRNSSPDRQEIELMLENLFLSLLIISKKGIPVENIVMPVLGAGHQKIDQKKIIPSLLKITERFLNEIGNLKSIYFIEKDARKAKALSSGINKVLGRMKIDLESVKFGRSIRRSISRRAAYISTTLFPGEEEFLKLRETIEDDESQYYQVGILARRTLEFILKDVFSDDNMQLNDMIRMSRDFGFPAHIVSYMHLIRSFGNLSAHTTFKSDSIKPSMNEEDLMINLLAIDKVLEFWKENRCELRRKISNFLGV